MADIAAIFHWPLSELDALTFSELQFWRNMAVDRYNQMNTAKED